MSDELAMNLEEMEAAANGEFIAPAENEDTVPAGEDDTLPAEDDEIVPGDDGDDDDEEPEDTVPAGEDEENQPKMSRRSQRVKQLSDENIGLRHEKIELEILLKQATETNKQLTAMLTGGQQAQDTTQGDDDEILDTALATKTDERFAKLENLQFNSVKTQELSYIGGEQGEIFQKAVAAGAITVLQNAKTMGKVITPQQAEQLARQGIERQAKELFDQGAPAGALAQQLTTGAQYYDFIINQSRQTKEGAGQKPKSNVNMKKVEEARQKAGAPTIDKESVNIQGGMNIYQNELKNAQATDESITPEYMRKLGFA